MPTLALGATLLVALASGCDPSRYVVIHGQRVERPDFGYSDGDAANPKVRRGFCRECGSSLLWDEDGDARIAICAGTFDAPTGLQSKAHIYVASKGDYYPLADDGLLRLDEFK